jgi:hypothetical protein
MTGETPLSSQRIKELTMSKIKKNTTNRLSFRVLLVAAIIVALGVTAVAADQIWGVSGIDMGGFGDDLKPEKIELVDELGAPFSGGVTCNGATITPVSVLGDDTYFHLHLRVEAPDGTVLPDGISYQFDGLDAENRMTLDVPRDIYKDISCEVKVEILPDEDPTDNVKEFMIRWYNIDEHVDLRFNDGISKILTIRGLWEQTEDKEYREIFSWEFSFDIGRYELVNLAQAEVAGLSAWCDGADCQVTLQSMAISSLGIRYLYTADTPEDATQYPYAEFEIVLKDGTRCQTRRSGVGTDPETGAYGSSAQFYEYIPLENIDYILFGEHKIYVNA